MKIKQLYVGGERYTDRVLVVKVSPVETTASENDTLKSALAGISGGAIAKYSWSGFQAAHTLNHDQVVAGLVTNGLSPNHAPGIADAALEIIRAEPTKVLLVAVSAGGGTWAVLEAGAKLFGWRWAKTHKRILTLTVAGVAAVLYLILRWAGIAS